MIRPSLRPLQWGFFCLVLSTALGSAGTDSDDFNDGNDAGWTRLDPIAQALGSNSAALGNTWSFPGGSAYRLTAAASPDPTQLGPGRLGAIRSSVTFTHFCQSVDLRPGWTARPNTALGLLARVQPGVGAGATSGYACTYQTQGGDVQISRLDGEQPHDVSPAVKVTLDPAKAYRLVFIATGDYFEGRVYSLDDLSTPLAVTVGNDSGYTAGAGGLVIYDNGGGQGAVGDFDNYASLPLDPPAVQLATPAGEFELRWPVAAHAWVLQTSPTLATETWTDVPTGEWQPDGLQWLHSRLPALEKANYFRLALRLTAQ